MSKLMAFDTVFEQCSIALMADGLVIYEQTVPGSRGQTEIILSLVDEALSKTNFKLSNIDCLAFNRGPGAFSGIRINTAVVQALSVAHETLCVGVSSLAALADTAHQLHRFEGASHITAVMDARQDQVYAGNFIIKDGSIEPVIDAYNPYGNEFLAEYGSAVAADVIVGDGASLIETNAKLVQAQPTAGDIARLALSEYHQGRAVPAEHALPVYLRDNAWKTLAEQGK
ncbi:tRNA (adenosine(37)-N6)-threonylcarbamoyltransferase complex dimerization subunit type 1 TsaB [Moraxella canis]|uniref:tRNA threonylcarbamoyladenosine biosynthesis protein TsaB n=1 Tax=Moraxella canis TaxID=90239 RepID=A0A1S9ZLS1_9GAMM|nr:tRNA (adenosine(37)-N6)-threonylcarbamoyltransferase complex dimerization subunit type 1 TsaB [Moraxella canis]OOR84519.1 tRNA (adenosine(37)-N6)-threonylcarbamoyltransferase complex dimerization subunit type 1 TsaB [Moraxella canis]